MDSVVGIFTSQMDAENAVEKLKREGFEERNLLLLTPEPGEQNISVPTEDAESPGVGKAIGGVVGGAAGLAGGVVIGSVMLPGAGSILAIGLGAPLGGVGGALIGGTAGRRLERLLSRGLPKDEFFLYEDALQQGRSLAIGFSSDDGQLRRGRKALNDCGAESIDAAREKWWIGLRDADEITYSSPDSYSKSEEELYRTGFEAALHPELREEPLSEAIKLVRQRYPTLWTQEAFRRGYERGLKYYREGRFDRKRQDGSESPA